MRQIQSTLSRHEKFPPHRRLTIEHRHLPSHARRDLGGAESRWPAPDHGNIDRFHSNQLKPREILRVDEAHRPAFGVDHHDVIDPLFTDLFHRLHGE